MDNMTKTNKPIKDVYDITPVSARAIIVVEEGQVEAIIDGHLFSFTINEYSDGNFTVLLDSKGVKARRMLQEYGATFSKDTLDRVHGDEFNRRIKEIYSLSNSQGGMGCSWAVENLDEMEYKEFK